MKLAEDSLVHSRPKQWAARVLIAVGLIALVTLLTMGVRHLINKPDAPKRQTAKITILPDTPPPPPPPPKDEPKREQPKDDVKQVMQDQPKQADTPPPEAPIKMEGAAGDGPSAFAAGSVSREYKDGVPVVGSPSAASAAGAAADRATARLYANTVRQLLRDEIEKNLRPDAGELVASFAVWVEGDGRIRRHEVVPSGDTRTDADMASALDGAARALRLPPPAGVQQPMRFKLNVRPQG